MEDTAKSSEEPQEPIIIDGKDITQPHRDWVGKCTRPPKKKNATFWKGFHIADDERNGQGKLYAVCNICGHKIISHNSGTTNLRRHMKSYHAAAFDKLLSIQEAEQGADGDAPRKRSVPPPPSSPSRPKKLKKKSSAKAMTPTQWADLAQAMYCIASNLPFSELDSPAMKEFVEACIDVGKANGNWIPKARTARTKVTAAIEKAQTVIADKLKESNDLVLAIDFWETRSNRNTVYICARWIDGFTLRHCFLGQLQYSGPDKPDDIVSKVQELLTKWEIQDKVSYIISNQELPGPEVGCKENIETIRCLDHDIQLLIEKSLGPVFGSSEVNWERSKNKVSRDVGRLREFAQNRASDVVEPDVVSRWWSSFTMAESMLGQVENDDDGLKESLDTLQAAVSALKPFGPAIKTLSGNLNCTSSLAPFLQFVIHSELSRAVQADTSLKTKSTTKDLLARFEARFGKKVAFLRPPSKGKGLHKAFLIAHALDPRFKQLKVLQEEADKETLWNALLEEMISLDPKAKSEGAPKESAGASGDAEAASILRGVVQKEEAKHDDSKDNIFDQYAEVLESGPPRDADSWKKDCANELKLYLAESTVGMRTDNGKEDPLSWWKNHRVSFPTLWRLAKVYLAIPATSSLPRLTMNVHASTTELGRYDLCVDLPKGSDFLFENRWILDELSR